MPEKITLADGTEREVPTQQELDDLKAKVVDPKTIEDRVRQEMEGEMSPDWRAVRPILSKSKKIVDNLKAKGFTVDEEGNIIAAGGGQGGGEGGGTKIDAEAALKSAEERGAAAGAAAATNMLLGEKKTAFLAKYPKETQAVIDVWFKKLSAGEQLTSESQLDFLQKATVLAVPGSVQVKQRGVPVVSGGNPVFEQKKTTHADTAEGEAAANFLFGDESFAKQKKDK